MKLNNPSTATSDEAAIRDVIEAIATAVRERNVDATLEQCTADFLSFDLVPPLQHQGPEAARKVWEMALDSLEGHAEYEVHQLRIEVGGNVAVGHCLTWFGGTRQGGNRAVNWLRMTLGFRKDQGRWRVSHQHVSVPFDMDSSKALLDLKP